jgi:hypothetical protein
VRMKSKVPMADHGGLSGLGLAKFDARLERQKRSRGYNFLYQICEKEAIPSVQHFGLCPSSQ